MSRERLTKDIINKRLVDRRIQLVGDYESNKIKTLYRCSENHEWLARTDSILSGKGCSQCYDAIRSKGQRLDIDIVIERLAPRGISMIGTYLGNKRPALLRCSNDHTWEARLDNVLSGAGCPQCIMISKEVIDDRLKKLGITLIGEYINTKTKTLLRCSMGHEWMAVVLAGCPSCNTGGFNTERSAYAYLLQFPATAHFEAFLKFGITNDLEQRLKDHRRGNGEFTVVATLYYETGRDALEWERSIKKTHGGRFATKERCPDGYTETLSVEKLSVLVESLQKN